MAFPLITDPHFYAVAIPAVLLLGISKSGFGAGFGSLAVPMMALAVTVPQAAAILMPLLLLMDVLGIAYSDFTREQREHVCEHHPRETNFKENIIDHFAKGIIKKPLTTFGNVKADILALKDMNYVRSNFCAIILGSAWPH